MRDRSSAEGEEIFHHVRMSLLTAVRFKATHSLSYNWREMDRKILHLLFHLESKSFSLKVNGP